MTKLVCILVNVFVVIQLARAQPKKTAWSAANAGMGLATINNMHIELQTDHPNNWQPPTDPTTIKPETVTETQTSSWDQGPQQIVEYGNQQHAQELQEPQPIVEYGNQQHPQAPQEPQPILDYGNQQHPQEPHAPMVTDPAPQPIPDYGMPEQTQAPQAPMVTDPAPQPIPDYGMPEQTQTPQAPVVNNSATTSYIVPQWEKQSDATTVSQTMQTSLYGSATETPAIAPAVKQGVNPVLTSWVDKHAHVFGKHGAGITYENTTAKSTTALYSKLMTEMEAAARRNSLSQNGTSKRPLQTKKQSILMNTLPDFTRLLMTSPDTSLVKFERLLLMKTLAGLIQTMGVLQNFILESRTKFAPATPKPTTATTMLPKTTTIPKATTTPIKTTTKPTTTTTMPITTTTMPTTTTAIPVTTTTKTTFAKPSTSMTPILTQQPEVMYDTTPNDMPIFPPRPHKPYLPTNEYPAEMQNSHTYNEMQTDVSINDISKSSFSQTTAEIMAGPIPKTNEIAHIKEIPSANEMAGPIPKTNEIAHIKEIPSANERWEKAIAFVRKYVAAVSKTKPPGPMDAATTKAGTQLSSQDKLKELENLLRGISPGELESLVNIIKAKATGGPAPQVDLAPPPQQYQPPPREQPRDQRREQRREQAPMVYEPQRNQPPPGYIPPPPGSENMGPSREMRNGPPPPIRGGQQRGPQRGPPPPGYRGPDGPPMGNNGPPDNQMPPWGNNQNGPPNNQMPPWARDGQRGGPPMGGPMGPMRGPGRNGPMGPNGPMGMGPNGQRGPPGGLGGLDPTNPQVARLIRVISKRIPDMLAGRTGGARNPVTGEQPEAGEGGAGAMNPMMMAMMMGQGGGGGGGGSPDLSALFGGGGGMGGMANGGGSGGMGALASLLGGGGGGGAFGGLAGLNGGGGNHMAMLQQAFGGQSSSGASGEGGMNPAMLAMLGGGGSGGAGGMGFGALNFMNGMGGANFGGM